MASFGSVFKNGLIFLVLSAPFLYVGALVMVHALDLVLNSYDGIDYNEHPSAKLYLFLGLLAAFGGGGMMYLKALSDTVEEGLDY